MQHTDFYTHTKKKKKKEDKQQQKGREKIIKRIGELTSLDDEAK